MLETLPGGTRGSSHKHQFCSSAPFPEGTQGASAPGAAAIPHPNRGSRAQRRGRDGARQPRRVRHIPAGPAAPAGSRVLSAGTRLGHEAGASRVRCLQEAGMCRGEDGQKAPGGRRGLRCVNYRRVKALEVGLGVKFGLKTPGICKVQEAGLQNCTRSAGPGAFTRGGLGGGHWVLRARTAGYSHATRPGSCSTAAPIHPWISSPAQLRSAAGGRDWGEEIGVKRWG